MELTKVMVCDPDNPGEIMQWAAENCPSVASWEGVDVSDVSGHYDMMYEFRFSDPAEATMFVLRWGTK
jgi:hypothetical protein